MGTHIKFSSLATLVLRCEITPLSKLKYLFGNTYLCTKCTAVIVCRIKYVKIKDKKIKSQFFFDVHLSTNM